jgi:hypothetical protein
MQNAVTCSQCYLTCNWASTTNSSTSSGLYSQDFMWGRGAEKGMLLRYGKILKNEKKKNFAQFEGISKTFNMF